MSQRDLIKYEVINKTINKEITVKKAGELLKLTERQVYNLKAAIKKKGASGVIHANRGKPGNRRIPQKQHQRIVSLLHSSYSDFKPTHASEKLDEIHGIKRDPKTIRSIMISQGLWQSRKSSRVIHRSARPRREYYGEMEQFDGSYHHWLEDRGGTGEICLLAAIDDAMGKITRAQFDESEGVIPVFTFWNEYLCQHGKPHSIYLDRLRTYYNNILPEQDPQMLTQFQRAMKELDIKPIMAHSPQAKGRVERLFNTLQDRLVKEMRLRNISDIESANLFLKKEFIPWFNDRYSIEPKKKSDLHRKLSTKEKKRLPSIFSNQSSRVISNDFTIRFNNQWYQLDKEQPATVKPTERVLMEERLDGSLWIRLRDKYLNYHITDVKPSKPSEQPWIIAASQKTKPTKTKAHKPAPDHPWRKSFITGYTEISKSR